jgi:hypothetical protein
MYRFSVSHLKAAMARAGISSPERLRDRMLAAGHYVAPFLPRAWVSGKAAPRGEDALVLAEVLNVRVADLYEKAAVPVGAADCGPTEGVRGAKGHSSNRASRHGG